MSRIISPTRGFTLIEVIATLVVVSIMGAAVSTLIYRSSRDYVDAAVGGQLHADLEAALDRSEREVRQIREKPATAGAADLSSVTSSSIAWISAGGACSLSLSGTQLMLASDGGASVALADNVTTFTVAAHDQSNAAVALPANAAACEAIRRISITITMSRNGKTGTLRTKVFLRATMLGGAS
jgi:prepilin-type N-terminal cleavage/methylation domain-containing protein